MRIVICGYYGFSNAGDELILDSTVGLLRKQLPNVEIAVITYPRGDLGALFDRLGVTAIDGRDIAHCSTMIRSADMVLIGGGGLIQDYLPSDRRDLFLDTHSNLVFWMTIAALARLHHVPVIGWQLGIGPLDSHQGREDAAMIFELLDRVFVRDQHSYELALEVGCSPDVLAVGADPVLTLEAERYPARSPRVGVVVRTWLEEGGWLNSLAEALDALDPSIEFVFYPMQETDRHLEDDVTASQIVAASLNRPSRMATSLTPDQLSTELAQCTAVVSMRLHGALLALAAGVPAVAMAYDPKVQAQMSALGQERFVAPIDQIDTDWLTSAIQDAMAHTVDLAPIAAAAGRVEQALSELVDSFEVDPRPLPIEITERLVAGRAAQIRLAREEADRAVSEATSHRDVARAELDGARAELEAARERAAQAVRLYEELAGSRAVSLASVAWRIKDRVRNVMRR